MLYAACGAESYQPSLEASSAPPRIEAVRIGTPPQIDGNLDDPCWQTATRVEGSWRMVVDAAELEPTEAWICYGEEAIYAAFRCQDSKPSTIRSDQKKRQGNMGRDDTVELGIDPDNNGTDVYTFHVNAAGVQNDQVPGEPDNPAFRLGTSMDWPFEDGGHYFRANHFGSTTDGEGGDGSSANVYLSTRRHQGWSYSASYEAYQPEFRADDGYVPETGVRNVFLSTSHSRIHDEGRLQHNRLGLEAWTGESQVGDRRGYWGNYDWGFRTGQAFFTGGGREERHGFEDGTFLLGAKWNRNDFYHYGEVRLN
jgi:hypothetical protein